MRLQNPGSNYWNVSGGQNGVGRARPDLIARCKPKEDTPADKLVTYLVCTETDHHTLHDGFRSFPSGHSSFSFAGLGYLSLSVQEHLFKNPAIMWANITH